MIYTTLDTMTKVYDLLEKNGLQGMLTGNTNGLSDADITTTLIFKGVMQELITLITHGEVDADTIEIETAMEMLSDFFLGIGKAFAKLSK
jgi:hypothetical protein